MNDAPAANANTSNPHDDMHRDLIHLLQIRHELQLAVSFLDGMDLRVFKTMSFTNTLWPWQSHK